MGKILSLAWLSVGIALLVLSLRDIQNPYWRPGWLLVGFTASGLAIWSAVAMFFGLRARKTVSVLTALCFAVYWIYLFMIAPPREVNGFLITGTAIICLAIATAVYVLAPTHS